MSGIIEVVPIHVLDGESDALDIARELAKRDRREEPFFVMQMGEVLARLRAWRRLLPTVTPFYAVKCNNDPVILATLAAMGAGFDCASKAELDIITSMGVEPHRIIFAQPAKLRSHIVFAATVGVDTMTFDCDHELVKMKEIMPHVKAVLRFRYDSSNARYSLGVKFGCDPLTEAPRLLRLAAELNVQVVGVAFHVGSSNEDSTVFRGAIEMSRALFEEGEEAGHHMTLLDIGGGFEGAAHTSIDDTALVINSALSDLFPPNGRLVTVIAEPGRYFAEAAYTLAVQVIAKKYVKSKTGENHTMYYINDGIHGSLEMYGWNEPRIIQPLQPSTKNAEPCSIWGFTYESMDNALSVKLPPLDVGDWLAFHDTGAYTLCILRSIKGHNRRKVHPFIDRKNWNELKKSWPRSQVAIMPPGDTIPTDWE